MMRSGLLGRKRLAGQSYAVTVTSVPYGRYG
jgi:hypothetical protein